MKNPLKETADIFNVTNREICLFVISAIIIVAFLGYLEQREKATVSSVLSGEVTLTSSQSTDIGCLVLVKNTRKPISVLVVTRISVSS